MHMRQVLEEREGDLTMRVYCKKSICNNLQHRWFCTIDKDQDRCEFFQPDERWHFCRYNVESDGELSDFCLSIEARKMAEMEQKG